MPVHQWIFARRRRFVAILLLSFALGDLVLFFFLPLQYLYPSQPELPRLGHVKMAAILFSGFNDTFTGINSESERRVQYGKTLLKNKLVEKLVVVGGNRSESKRKGAQLMADYLLAAGVKEDQILVEVTSSESRSNLEQYYRILREKGVVSGGLISSPYHLLRIKRMQILPQVQFTYLPYNPFDCIPPLTRKEIWWSAHYNLTAYLLYTFLPESMYRDFVHWVRTHTDW